TPETPAQRQKEVGTSARPRDADRARCRQLVLPCNRADLALYHRPIISAFHETWDNGSRGHPRLEGDRVKPRTVSIASRRPLRTLLAFAALAAAGRPAPLNAHGTEARRVVVMTWTRDHIVRTVAANRSELGLNGSKAPEQ